MSKNNEPILEKEGAIVPADTPCAMCEMLGTEEEVTKHNNVWYAFSARLNLNDAINVAEKNEIKIGRQELWEHLWEHRYVQPHAQGKFVPEKAVQEAIATFPDYYFWILRTLYRTGGLSELQIKKIFYTPYYETEEVAEQQFLDDFRKLIFRSFVFRYYPEQESVLFEDQREAFYFLNRQALPVVENLEKVKIPFKSYVTGNEQVENFHLEEDSHLWECFTKLRTSLYNRDFNLNKTSLTPHLSVENIYTANQLSSVLPATQRSQPVTFAPSMFAALRIEDNSNLSLLLPFFIEYDRGIKEMPKVVDKLITYLRFYTSPNYKDIFPLMSSVQGYIPPVFVVTDTPSRAGLIIKQLESKIPNLQPIYFCDYETFKNNPWEDGVWRTINTGPEERFTLFPRLLFHSQSLSKSKIYYGRDKIKLGKISDPKAVTPKPKKEVPKPAPAEPVKPKSTTTRNVDDSLSLEDYL